MIFFHCNRIFLYAFDQAPFLNYAVWLIIWSISKL